MSVIIDGTDGITTPELDSSGPVAGTTGTFSGAVSGTTGTFSGAVQASGVATNLYPLVSGTSVASTSGTSIDFTGIPSWVKRITVMFSSVSLSSSSYILVQLGDSGGVETSGYLGYCAYIQGGGGSLVNSNGFNLYGTGSAAARNNSGSIIFTKVDGNIWVAQGLVSFDSTSFGDAVIHGSKTLSDTLDRIRVTSNSGTDTFDAGTINILYE